MNRCDLFSPPYIRRPGTPFPAVAGLQIGEPFSPETEGYSPVYSDLSDDTSFHRRVEECASRILDMQYSSCDVRVALENPHLLPFKVTYSAWGRVVRTETNDGHHPLFHISGLRGEFVQFETPRGRSPSIQIQDLEGGVLKVKVSEEGVLAERADCVALFELDNPDGSSVQVIRTRGKKETAEEVDLDSPIEQIRGGPDEWIRFCVEGVESKSWRLKRIHGHTLRLAISGSSLHVMTSPRRSFTPLPGWTK